MPAALTRLTRYLIVKSIIDVLIVGTIALVFYFRAFNPLFHGWVDSAGADTVSGWVVDGGMPFSRAEVQLYIDDRFVGSRIASESRPDLVASHRADDEWHGFVFRTPQLGPGDHEARVYVVRKSNDGRLRTLEMIGPPTRFNLAADQSRADAAKFPAAR